MSKLYKLLISFVGLTLIHTCGYAEEGQIEYNLSGFLTGTAFSDHDWYNNSANTALNVDISYNDYALRAQVAVPYTETIKRLVLEKAFTVKPNHDIVMQVGRFPRLTSFYNEVTSSPGSNGYAMTPLGEFGRRLKDNDTFTTLDGVRLSYNTHVGSGILKITGDYGQAIIEDQCLLQAEISRDNCVSNYAFSQSYGNYDLGVAYEINKFSFSAYTGKVKANILKLSDNPVGDISDVSDKFDIQFMKYGVKYTERKWWIQSEIFIVDFNLYKDGTRLPTMQGDISDWDTGYILVGYNWNDRLSSYIEYSAGKSNTTDSARDVGIGITYVRDSRTFSLEYHKGNGSSWKKYYSPTESWDSWVATYTRRF